MSVTAPLSGPERLAVRREIEAVRVAAVEKFRDTPGQQWRRREAADRDAEYWLRTRRAS